MSYDACAYCVAWTRCHAVRFSSLHSIVGVLKILALRCVGRKRWVIVRACNGKYMLLGLSAGWHVGRGGCSDPTRRPGGRAVDAGRCARIHRIVVRRICLLL